MFVIRDLKIIEGAKGFFVAMPSRKLTDRCHNCGTKNHLRSRFCNQCGCRLDENRALRDADGRAKLHADIAHPINSMCREKIQAAVLNSYAEELERSKMPGYVSRYDEYEVDDFDVQYDPHAAPPIGERQRTAVAARSPPRPYASCSRRPVRAPRAAPLRPQGDGLRGSRLRPPSSRRIVRLRQRALIGLRSGPHGPFPELDLYLNPSGVIPSRVIEGSCVPTRPRPGARRPRPRRVDHPRLPDSSTRSSAMSDAEPDTPSPRETARGPNEAASPRPPTSRRRKRIMKIARLFALVYIGSLIVITSFQTRIIFPGQETQGQDYAQVRPRPGTELVRLKSRRGEPIVALFGPALTPEGRPHPDAAGRPTLIYFYGNAMCLNDATGHFERFRRLGLNVIIPDYLGYGMSGGSASERGCQATSEAVYDYLVATRGIKPSRIVAAGWSLGGAVAVDLASRKPVAGLIIFSAFTSGVDMGRRLMPFFPVSLLLRHRFDSLHKIPQVECPILIGHGRRDRIVPFDMGQRLAAAAKGPVTTTLDRPGRPQ